MKALPWRISLSLGVFLLLVMTLVLSPVVWALETEKSKATVPSNAVPSSAVPSNAVPSNAVPSNAVPSPPAEAEVPNPRSATEAPALSGRELELAVVALGETLRCPTCQGASVNDSEAGFSRNIREKIRQLLQAGQTEAQIQAYFVERYGPWILRVPPAQGVGLLLWVLPVLAFLLALVLLLRVLWKTRRRAASPFSRKNP